MKATQTNRNGPAIDLMYQGDLQTKAIDSIIRKAKRNGHDIEMTWDKFKDDTTTKCWKCSTCGQAISAFNSLRCDANGYPYEFRDSAIVDLGLFKPCAEIVASGLADQHDAEVTAERAYKIFERANRYLQRRHGALLNTPGWPYAIPKSVYHQLWLLRLETRADITPIT